LKLKKRTVKMMGRTEKGLDFLRFQFCHEGLSMAEETIEKFPTHVVRLYEQEQEEPSGFPLLELWMCGVRRRGQNVLP
jgi:hypothetical protein